MSGCRNVGIVFERPTSPVTSAARIDSKDDIRCAARSPDGTRIVSGKEDGRLNVWDGWTGKRIGMPVKGHSDFIYDIRFSPDGTKFVSGSEDGTVRVWDAHTHKIVWYLKSGSRVNAVAYSADGRRVVSGHDDGRLRIWDAQNGTSIAKSHDRHSYWVWSVVYSPDGRRIVSGSGDGTLMIWDVESGAAIGEPLKGHESAVLSVAYSSDGTRIVSGSYDERVQIWDARTGTPIGKSLRGHKGSVVDVGYSQDGNTIISASRDETTRFWNATDGSPVGVLPRGESRWDPARSHFVSIPEWWPRHWWNTVLRIQALVYSANPLYIPDDGWIRTLDGNLFLWIPREHRSCSCHAASESTMTTNLYDERLLARSAWKDLSEARDWTRIIKVEDSDG